MKVQLVKKHGGTVYDITDTVSDITWAGDYQQAARTFDFKVLHPTNDTHVLPMPVNPEIGDKVFWYTYGKEAFRGIVWSKTTDSSGQYMDISCYDDLIRLTKSEISKVYVNVSPEEIAGQLCSEFGIGAGSFASSGYTGNYVGIGKTMILHYDKRTINTNSTGRCK